MVPEGLNPTVHKMYITQGTYDAKDSARPKDRRSSLIHRKSSMFFNKADTNKEDWLLTNSEFETWNRLYRLTESDGVTDVVLPRTPFELFRDSETSKVGMTNQSTGYERVLNYLRQKLVGVYSHEYLNHQYLN